MAEQPKGPSPRMRSAASARRSPRQVLRKRFVNRCRCGVVVRHGRAPPRHAVRGGVLHGASAVEEVLSAHQGEMEEAVPTRFPRSTSCSLVSAGSAARASAGDRRRHRPLINPLTGAREPPAISWRPWPGMPASGVARAARIATPTGPSASSRRSVPRNPSRHNRPRRSLPEYGATAFVTRRAFARLRIP